MFWGSITVQYCIDELDELYWWKIDTIQPEKWDNGPIFVSIDRVGKMKYVKILKAYLC